MNNSSGTQCTHCAQGCHVICHKKGEVLRCPCPARSESFPLKEKNQGAAGNKSQQPVLSFLWSLVHHLTFVWFRVGVPQQKSVASYELLYGVNSLQDLFFPEIVIAIQQCTGCFISACMKTNAYQAIKNALLSHKNSICTFMRCGHLTYDPWIWLKVTSMASTASNRKSAKNP